MRIWQRLFCVCSQQHGDDAQGCGPPLNASTTYGSWTNRSHAHRVVFCFSFLVISYSLLVVVTVASQVTKSGDGAIGFIMFKTRTIGKLLTHQ
jgi:hypothetical protein